MSQFKAKILKSGYNVWVENLVNVDKPVYSYFNVIPYTDFLKIEGVVKPSIPKAIANSKDYQDLIKILAINGVYPSNNQVNEILNFLKEKKKHSKKDTKAFIKEMIKTSSYSRSSNKSKLKLQSRLLIARHVFYENDIQTFVYDIEIEEKTNILDLKAVFLKDSKKPMDDPDNIIMLESEFFFDNSNLALDIQDLPRTGKAGFKRAKVKIENLKKTFMELIREVIYLEKDEYYDFIFYWVLHTHLCRIWSHTSIIRIVASTASGKSTLLKFIALLNKRAQPVTQPSIASLFRMANTGYVLLWDENTSLRNVKDRDTQAVINILRSGYDQDTADIPRVNDDGTVSIFSSFCPKLICSEKDFPESLESLRNRMFAIPMKTARKSLMKINLVKKELKELCQQLADFAFSHFSLFFILTRAFFDMQFKREPRIVKYIENETKNLKEFLEDGRYYKLKQRMQDIALPLIILSSWNAEDLETMFQFFIDQQEAIKQEVKKLSPEFNLLACLNDIINKKWEKTPVKVYSKDEEKELDMDDYSEFKEGEVRIQHHYLKLILKAHYNVYKCTYEFIQDVFKAFNIIYSEINPQNRKWWVIEPDSVKDAFEVKKVAVGIDIEDEHIQKAEMENSLRYFCKEFGIEKPNFKELFNMVSNIKEYVSNVGETEFPDLQSNLNIFEPDSLKVCISCLVNQGIIKTDEGFRNISLNITPSMLMRVHKILANICSENNEPKIPFKTMVDRFSIEGIKENALNTILKRLKKEGLVFLYNNGDIKVISQ